MCPQSQGQTQAHPVCLTYVPQALLIHHDIENLYAFKNGLPVILSAHADFQ